MLILSRKPGEAVLVDGGIRIVVLGSEGGAVRLGIEAPMSVGIVREEVAERIAEENIRAGAQAEDRAWVEALGTRRPEAPAPKADSEEKPGSEP